MKRIPSPLFLAALPLLAPLFGALHVATSPVAATGPEPLAAAQVGLRPGVLGQEGAQDDPETADDDEAVVPDGLGDEDRSGYDIFGRKTRERAATFEERLQGGWRLTRMDIRGSNPRGRVAQGFLHVGKNFLSMEIHALWESGGGFDVPESDVHTTFTAEYQLDNSGKLYCSTVIGSFIDESTGELDWEREGFEREFYVREVRSELELTYKEEGLGESKLYFQPFLPRGRGELDIFGRQEVGAFGGTDIYGRKTARTNGETDIYGRPVAPPTDEEAKPDSEVPLPPKGPGAGGSPLSGRNGGG